MIITFCGHAQFRATEQCERELLTFPETHVGDSPAQMYLGGYGEFDSFALRCCRKYRETHPQIKLVLVPRTCPIPISATTCAIRKAGTTKSSIRQSRTNRSALRLFIGISTWYSRRIGS